MKYIIAHDLGTSGNKATLFSQEGKLIDSCIHTYPVHYFNENFAEQNADDWWDAVCKSTKGLLTKTKISNTDIAVVSFSGQMMGCLPVDKQGKPLRPSIIWADRRAEKQSAKLQDKITQWDFYHIVGHRNTASYGIQKLMWIKENEPEIYENTYKMLNAKDYIVFRLTGNFYTDYSDGNSCGCFDLQKLIWSEKILKYAEIELDKLPELKPSTFIGGYVTETASLETGLYVGTPVVLGGGDGVTANVGTGSVRPGRTYCSMGTSAWITTTSEKPIFDKKMRIVNWAHIIPGYYAPNGTMQSAGASYSWLKETICLMEQYNAKLHGKSPYDYINREIEKSPAGANGVIFLPYLLGERAPRWNPHAKASFMGIDAQTTRQDLMRSVLEGVTMNLSVCLDILRTQVDISELVAVGGGAKSSIWRQIMADIYDARILVPTVLEEASSMGAAVTGGVGVGLYGNFNVIEKFVEFCAVHVPNNKNADVYRKAKELFDAYYYALESVYSNGIGQRRGEGIHENISS